MINVERRAFLRRAGGAACAWSGTVLPASGAVSTGEKTGLRRARTGNIPAYVPVQGQVTAIAGPGSDSPGTMANVMYGTPAGPGSRTGNSYFGNWCSGVFAHDDGELGAMVFCNGGDADYWGNEVYRFSLDTRIWSRISERSTGLNGRTGAADDDPNFDATAWGEHASPGGVPPPQPGVPHSYDQMEYLPPQLGGGTQGSFMFATRTIVYRYRRYRHPHVFDLNARKWRRGSATPGIVTMASSDAPSWCFDSRRNRFWGIVGGASGIYTNTLHMLAFDPGSGLATAQNIRIPQYLTPWGCPVSRYWPRGDMMVVAGQDGGSKAFGLWACDLANAGERGFIALSLTGESLPPAGAGYGFAYCDELNCFFVRMASGHRQNIWKIVPPETGNLFRAWRIEQIHMTGVTVATQDNGQGMWKRLMYAPSLKCLLWVDDIHGPVYAYRPFGT